MAKKSTVLVDGRGHILGGNRRPLPPREFAKKLGEEGMCTVMLAINICDHRDLPYRYSQDAINEFILHAAAIKELIETAEIVERPGIYAKSDADFQRFMALAAGSPAA